MNFGFGGLQKLHFFKFTNYQYFFTKISGSGKELFCEFHSFFFVHYDGLHLFYFTLIGSWITWFISSWENIKFYVKLNKFIKWQLFLLKMTTLFIQDTFNSQVDQCKPHENRRRLPCIIDTNTKPSLVPPKGIFFRNDQKKLKKIFDRSENFFLFTTCKKLNNFC